MTDQFPGGTVTALQSTCSTMYLALPLSKALSIPVVAAGVADTLFTSKTASLKTTLYFFLVKLSKQNSLSECVRVILISTLFNRSFSC